MRKVRKNSKLGNIAILKKEEGRKNKEEGSQKTQSQEI